ncbi:MAG: hypothetical protein GC156_13965 [Actinomycetales bacterium]|nr:hypothetical protein [Actinomycetales bacterium]
MSGFAIRVREARLPDSGSVLVETAIAIPVLLMVAAALAWAVTLGSSALALQEIARQVARDVARGVDLPSAVAAAEDAVPGAVVSVQRTSGGVEVEAAREVAAPVPLLAGITVPLRSHLTVPQEWS